MEALGIGAVPEVVEQAAHAKHDVAPTLAHRRLVVELAELLVALRLLAVPRALVTEAANPKLQQAGKCSNRRPGDPDLRLRWWPGAGSNRRPTDFQSVARTN